METQDLIDILKKQRNEDETKWFETRRAILEYYKATLPLDSKDSFFEEDNRLAKEIYKSINNQKQE